MVIDKFDFYMGELLMIENVERKGNLFFVKALEQITKEDINYVAPMIEKVIKECKKIKLFIYLNEVKSHTLGGLIASFVFYFKCMNSFKGIAVVGNNEKQKKLIRDLKKFFPCNAKYFDVSKIQDAETWINQF